MNPVHIRPPGQQPQDIYYGQQPPQYGQPAPAYEAPLAPMPVYRRPGVVFGTAAVVAVIAVGPLLATWVSDMTTGDPNNPAPEELLCHPNPLVAQETKRHRRSRRSRSWRKP